MLIVGGVVFLLLGTAIGLLLGTIGVDFSPGGTEPLKSLLALSRPPRGRAVELYFLDNRSGDLRAESISLPLELEEQVAIRKTIEALIEGPQLDGLSSLLPVETRLLHLFFDGGGNVTVDFSPAIQSTFQGGTRTETLMLRSLVGTLLGNFAEIQSIELLVDGRAVRSLGGHVALPQLLRRQDSLPASRSAAIENREQGPDEPR